MGNCDLDFNPVYYLYLNPELVAYSNVYTVEQALDHYMVHSNEGLLWDLTLPPDFNHKVYYLDAQEVIRSNHVLDADLTSQLEMADLERLAAIHYMREGYDLVDSASNLQYKIADNFIEQLYRTFSRITTIGTEEELYLDYFARKRNKENVIGSYDDLEYRITSNFTLDMVAEGNTNYVFPGVASFENDVIFKQQVYFGRQETDTPQVVTFDVDAVFHEPVDFQQGLDASGLYLYGPLRIHCDTSNVPPPFLETYDTRAELFTMDQGANFPGAVLGTENNVIHKPTYFMDTVYFGSNALGVCNGSSSSGRPGLIDLESDVHFQCNISLDGTLTASNLVVSNLTIPCGDQAYSNAMVQQVLSNSADFFSIDDLRVPGAVFASNANVFTQPTYFAGEVIFGNCIQGFGGTGSGTSNIVYVDSGGSGVNMSFSNEDIVFASNVTIQGSLIAKAGITIPYEQFLESYDLVEQAYNHAPYMTNMDGVSLPGAIFDGSVNVITKPTYFAAKVVFGSDITREELATQFDKDVIFESNVYMWDNLYVDKVIHARTLEVDNFFLTASNLLDSNLEFASNVTVHENLYTDQNLYVGSNAYVQGTLDVGTLRIQNAIQLPISRSDPLTTEAMVTELFADETGSNQPSVQLTVFEGGGVFPGAVFGANGSLFTKPLYLNNDVYFGGEIFLPQTGSNEIMNLAGLLVREEAIFLSNVEIEGITYLKNNLFSTGNLDVGGSITATSFHPTSDERIKQHMRPIDTTKAFGFLDDIEVMEYRLKTEPAHADLYYGVMAQQVESVGLTNVVHDRMGFIPSVYRPIQVLKQGTTVFITNHGFAKGDKIRFVSDLQPGGAFVHEHVSVISKILTLNSFTLETPFALEYVPTGHQGGMPIPLCMMNWICWGQWVHDFKSVDMQQLLSLCVSAVQDLRQRVAALEAITT